MPGFEGSPKQHICAIILGMTSAVGPPAAPLHDAALSAAVTFLTGAPNSPALVPWGRLRREDFRLLREWTSQGYTPEAARRVLLAVRRAVRSSEGAPEDEACAPLPRAALMAATRCRLVQRVTPALGQRSARMLLEACDADDAAARRDAAMIALMLNGGVTAAQAIALRCADYDDSTRVLRLPAPAARTRRALLIAGDTAAKLECWLEVAGRGGPLFRVVDSRGVTSAPLTPRLARQALQQRAAAAGLPPLTPTDLRLRFLAGLRERVRRESGPLAVRVEAEDGQPILLYHVLD
jgi:integrase